jgi:hypothetical protein
MRIVSIVLFVLLYSSTSYCGINKSLVLEVNSEHTCFPGEVFKVQISVKNVSKKIVRFNKILTGKSGYVRVYYRLVGNNKWEESVGPGWGLKRPPKKDDRYSVGEIVNGAVDVYIDYSKLNILTENKLPTEFQVKIKIYGTNWKGFVLENTCQVTFKELEAENLKYWNALKDKELLFKVLNPKQSVSSIEMTKLHEFSKTHKGSLYSELVNLKYTKHNERLKRRNARLLHIKHQDIRKEIEGVKLKAIVTKYVDYWNTHKWNEIINLLSPESFVHRQLKKKSDASKGLIKEFNSNRTLGEISNFKFKTLNVDDQEAKASFEFTFSSKNIHQGKIAFIFIKDVWYIKTLIVVKKLIQGKSVQEKVK